MGTEGPQRSNPLTLPPRVDDDDSAGRAVPHQFPRGLAGAHVELDGFDVASRICLDHRAPMVVLTSSRDPREFGPLVSRSGARGFIPKGELTGDALTALL